MSTPVKAYYERLLQDGDPDANLFAELEREEIHRLARSLGGKSLVAHMERKQQWAVGQIMETIPGDAGKISFLQAYHYFCSEYISFLTPPLEDPDEQG